MSIWGKIWDKVTDIGHNVTGMPTSKEKRQQQSMMNEQIKSYREQTRIATEETQRLATERKAEKRRVQEKQIRSLRRSFRPAGFLDTGSDISQPLGG